MESFHSKEDSYSAVLACRHIRLILQKGMAARVTIWPVYDLLRRVIGYAMPDQERLSTAVQPGSVPKSHGTGGKLRGEQLTLIA